MAGLTSMSLLDRIKKAIKSRLSRVQLRRTGKTKAAHSVQACESHTSNANPFTPTVIHMAPEAMRITKCRASQQQMESEHHRRFTEAIEKALAQVSIRPSSVIRYSAQPLNFDFSRRASFLDLPAEIRNKIYRYYLVFQGPLELHPLSLVRDRRKRAEDYKLFRAIVLTNTAAARNFLRVSKQVNREASGIFYGENEFRFSAPMGWFWLRGFMVAIGERNSACLRLVTVCVPCLDYGRHTFYQHDRAINLAIENGNPDSWPPDQYRASSQAHRECIQMFEKSGTLAQLNLVLASLPTFEVPDLGFDYTKFETLPIVKLVDINRHDGKLSSGQLVVTPANHVRAGRLFKRTKPLTWTGTRSYARAQGWAFQLVRWNEYDHRRISSEDDDEPCDG